MPKIYDKYKPLAYATQGFYSEQGRFFETSAEAMEHSLITRLRETRKKFNYSISMDEFFILLDDMILNSPDDLAKYIVTYKDAEEIRTERKSYAETAKDENAQQI